MTHCRRELMHAIWEFLIDKEFVEAYDKGIEMVFPDGVKRRAYLRIITYATDYIEKYNPNVQY